jgi:hypothetical protein
MTEGCDEIISFEFLMWLLFKGRTKRRRDKFLAIQMQYPTKTFLLKSQKQIDDFMKKYLLENEIE